MPSDDDGVDVDGVDEKKMVESKKGVERSQIEHAIFSFAFSNQKGGVKPI